MCLEFRDSFTYAVATVGSCLECKMRMASFYCSAEGEGVADVPRYAFRNTFEICLEIPLRSA